MKKFTICAFTLVSILALAPQASAQNCWINGDPSGVADRPSPLDSATVMIGGDEVKVCYGAPSARGRTLVGGDIHPHGSKWRMGANEATAIHLPFAATVAGVPVSAGSYSLYAITGADSWEIFVNSVADRWGANMGAGVEANDLGSGMVSASANEHVERMMMSFEDTNDNGALLVLTWEGYRVEIPVRRQS